MAKRSSGSPAREYLVVFGPALLIAFAGFWIAYFYVILRGQQLEIDKFRHVTTPK